MEINQIDGNMTESVKNEFLESIKSDGESNSDVFPVDDVNDVYQVFVDHVQNVSNDLKVSDTVQTSDIKDIDINENVDLIKQPEELKVVLRKYFDNDQQIDDEQTKESLVFRPSEPLFTLNSMIQQSNLESEQIDELKSSLPVEKNNAQDIEKTLSCDTESSNSESIVNLTQVSVTLNDDNSVTMNGGDPLIDSSMPSLLSNPKLLFDSNQRIVLSFSDGVNVSNFAVGSITTDNNQTLINAEGLVDANGAPFFQFKEDGGIEPAEVFQHSEVEAGSVESCVNDIKSSSSLECSKESLKRKGGWPKGKRRKQQLEVERRKPPPTGYVIYAKERRSELKKLQSELSFSELTRQLGAEWSAMTAKKKKIFLDRAEAAKKEYIENMKAYQQSEEYQHYLKLKRMKGENINGVEDTHFVAQFDSNEFDDPLYCKVCDQFFSTLHNKKEHFFGKNHHQNVSEQLSEAVRSKNSDVETSSVASLAVSPDAEVPSTSSDSLLNIQNFVVSFFENNSQRENEVHILERTLSEARNQRNQLVKQLQELQMLKSKLEQDIGNASAFAAALHGQLNSLKMLPHLFGVNLDS